MDDKTVFMPEQDFRTWIAALRSGKYKQGKQRLLTGDARYCCLGVLQHCLTGDVERIAASSEIGRALPSDEWLVQHRIVFFDGDLEVRSPRLTSDGENASYLNDFGATFAEIADALEAAYGGEVAP